MLNECDGADDTVTWKSRAVDEETGNPVLALPFMVRVCISQAMQAEEMEVLRVVEFLNKSQLVNVTNDDSLIDDCEFEILFICECRGHK